MKFESWILLMSGVLIGLLIVMPILDHKWKRNTEIVEQGCGQYNRTTGDFEWVKKELK